MLDSSRRLLGVDAVGAIGTALYLENLFPDSVFSSGVREREMRHHSKNGVPLFVTEAFALLLLAESTFWGTALG